MEYFCSNFCSDN